MGLVTMFQYLYGDMNGIEPEDIYYLGEEEEVKRGLHYGPMYIKTTDKGRAHFKRLSKPVLLSLCDEAGLEQAMPRIIKECTREELCDVLTSKRQAVRVAATSRMEELAPQRRRDEND